MAEGVDWKEECKDLLVILNQSNDSDPFREPIDILYVPDYLDTIEHPMDLQTVGVMSGWGNVRLIVENSKKFNPNTKSKIYGQTDRLSLLFEEQFRHILSYGSRKTSAQSKSKLFLMNSSFVNLQFLQFFLRQVQWSALQL